MPEARALLRPALLPVLAAVIAAWAVLAVAPQSNFWVMWLAMAVAMMLPSATRPLARAAQGSSARGMMFAAGFLMLWAVAGVPAWLIMRSVTWTPSWIAAVWAAAGMYQLTPVMRRHLSTCASIDFRNDPLRYGVRQGVRCVTSCGPLMIAVSVTAMVIPQLWLALAVLVAMTALVCWQKRVSTSPRAVAAWGLAIVLVAAVAWVVAGSGAVHHDMPSMSMSAR